MSESLGLKTRLIIALRRLLNKIIYWTIRKKQKRHSRLYSVKEQLALKGRIAPRGKCFLIVTFKQGKITYYNSALVSIKGDVQPVKDRLAYALFLDLLKKYDLKAL